MYNPTAATIQTTRTHIHPRKRPQRKDKQNREAVAPKEKMAFMIVKAADVPAGWTNIVVTSAKTEEIGRRNVLVRINQKFGNVSVMFPRELKRIPVPISNAA